MLLSVVIPIYQAKRYLADCVGSVLAQRFGDYEIVLVDDGSTDGSADLCDGYASRYPFIRAVHQPNGGASAARNRGLREARGDYIHFIDSDDLLCHESVYTALAEEALHSRPDIVFFRRERFADGSDVIEAVQPAYAVNGVYDGDVLYHVLSQKYEMTLTCPVNKLFRRAFLLENALFFTEGLHHEEDEWLPRVIACADRVWFDSGVYYRVRNHADSLSQTTSDALCADRACSKIQIAVSGMAYMQQKRLPAATLSLAADYYWEYFIDACAAYNSLQEKENKQRVMDALRGSRRFIKSRRLLTSKNRRVLGVLFQTLGINLTVKLIGLRYGT